MVPNDGAATADALFSSIQRALGNADITLDEVAQATGIPGATWDFGDALSGLVGDAADLAVGAAKKIGAGAADALSPLLWEIVLAVAGLVLLVVVLRRNGATLGGLL